MRIPAAITALAFTAIPLAAQLPQLSCPGAQVTREVRAAQEALDRTLISQGGQRQDYLQDALEHAAAAIRADPDNPYPHLHRGRALLGLVAFHGSRAGAEYTAEFPQSGAIGAGEAAEAGVASLDRAVQLCPELEAEARTLRESGGASALALGVERYSASDTSAAVVLWETAARIDSTNPGGLFNVGVVRSQLGDQAAAADYFRRVLAATAPGDTAWAEQRSVSLIGLLSAGNAAFQAERFAEAGELFAAIHAIDPRHRDALYNHALALYKLERWADLVPVATRLVQGDPLNYNAQVILFNAHKGLSEAAGARGDSAAERQSRMLALQTLEQADGLPVQLEGLRVEVDSSQATVRGTAVGGAAAQGTPIRIEFTLSNETGDVGTGTLTLEAPAKDARAEFQLPVTVTGAPSSYRYRQLP